MVFNDVIPGNHDVFNCGVLMKGDVFGMAAPLAQILQPRINWRHVE